MPSYAHLEAKAFCPHCGARVDRDGLVAFQWGYCPSRLPWDDLFYRFGDEIRWRLDDEGHARAWCYFEGTQQGGNLGDPEVLDLLVRALDLGGTGLVCAPCGAQDIAIRVARGRIECIAAGIAGCDIATIGIDGTVVPRPDWNDRPMPDVLRVRSRALTPARGDSPGKLAPP